MQAWNTPCVETFVLYFLPKNKFERYNSHLWYILQMSHDVYVDIFDRLLPVIIGRRFYLEDQS